VKSFFHIFYQLRGVFLENSAKNKISSASWRIKDGEYRLLASPSLGGPHKIPYVSQYASAELAERFVKNDEFLREDPKWRESGAETIDEYVFWAPKLCGMACFSMILQSLGCPTPKLVELGKQAMAAGCYLPDPKNPKRLIGLLHKPCLKFARQFGFEGKLLWFIGPSVVAREILKNNFVIASVNHDIRYAGAKPENKQGHLVLVHGFKIDGGKVTGFYIHNPSGFFGISQENHFVSAEDFVSCFSGRIIVLFSSWCG